VAVRTAREAGAAEREDRPLVAGLQNMLYEERDALQFTYRLKMQKKAREKRKELRRGEAWSFHEMHAAGMRPSANLV
jgi:hypothetical protein